MKSNIEIPLTEDQLKTFRKLREGREAELELMVFACKIATEAGYQHYCFRFTKDGRSPILSADCEGRTKAIA